MSETEKQATGPMNTVLGQRYVRERYNLKDLTFAMSYSNNQADNERSRRIWEAFERQWKKRRQLHVVLFGAAYGGPTATEKAQKEWDDHEKAAAEELNKLLVQDVPDVDLVDLTSKNSQAIRIWTWKDAPVMYKKDVGGGEQLVMVVPEEMAKTRAAETVELTFSQRDLLYAHPKFQCYNGEWVTIFAKSKV